MRGGLIHTYWMRAKNNAGVSAFSSYAVGYADIGKVDLELSSLVVSPLTWRVGGRPVSVVFVLKNWGPRSLVVPDTRLKISLYLSRHEQWGMGGEIALGSTADDVTVSAGSQLAVSLSQTALAGITVLSGMQGNYYVYVRGEPVSPSTLVLDPAWSNNVARTEGVIVVAPMVTSDFNGGGKSDPAICELSSGQWQVLLSGSGYALATAKMVISSHNQQLVSSDYDRDGKEDPGLYESASGQWQVLLSGSGYISALAQFSSSSDLSAVGDYDGDGQADPGIYESAGGQWQVLLSGSGYVPALVQLGGSPNVPAPADYDGDGKADPTVYDSSSSVMTVLLSASGYTPASTCIGSPQFNPRPVPGDYDGDRKADPAVYEEASGTWSVLLSGSGYQLVTAEGLGGAGYRAVAGNDYDGDGKTDPAVYGEADGVWVVWLSGTGYTMTCFPFGGAGFKAVGEK